MVLETTDKLGDHYTLTVAFVPVALNQDPENLPDGSPQFKLEGQIAIMTKFVKKAGAT